MNREILRQLGMWEELRRLDQGLCPTCGGKITPFRDMLSEKEFRISGMCQYCQDQTFVEVD